MDETGDGRSRWWLVLVAALVMGTAGVYQFGWSSIRPALGARVGAPETALGTAFTLFVVFQTVAQFPAGWVRDRYGPRLPLLVGAGCLTAGFSGLGFARSVPAVYLSYAVGGVGVAVAYTVTVNTAVKWFTDRRGLATSLVTMSFSGVSVLAIPAIRTGVEARFGPTMLALAAAVGAVAVLGGVVLRDPGGPDEGADGPTGGRAYTWREAIRTWQFWLLYAVFVVLNGVGLMVIGKAVAYASVLSLPPSAGTASASMIALGDACGILVVGTLSDYLGRVRSLAASLVLSGLSLGGAVLLGEAGFAWGFVALVAATVAFRSPSFAIVPSIVGEYYGRAHSSENYAVLYTAKLFGGVFGGVGASALVVSVGWSASFALGGGLLLLAGVAIAFLRPV
ncbi:oxalate:formate antiporter [Halobacteriales archaeon QS_5_70_15]|nr:MAG: oxalate:formate antiporter [Halobacteriales archaeon QS_5_70_15]